MTLAEKLRSLILAANATTGQSDTDMTKTTQSLIDGYGGSGGISFVVTNSFGGGDIFDSATLSINPISFVVTSSIEEGE